MSRGLNHTVDDDGIHGSAVGKRKTKNEKRPHRKSCDSTVGNVKSAKSVGYCTTRPLNLDPVSDV